MNKINGIKLPLYRTECLTECADFLNRKTLCMAGSGSVATVCKAKNKPVVVTAF
jgi:hypothetical protein